MADEQKEPDECFIVGVIGKAGSEQRIHADWFFEGIVRPLFTEHFPSMKVLRADHMKMPGIITSQIIEKLLNARLVISDLTFLNPNVFYEIGIRHMTGKAVVHVHRAGESIPFDISTFLSMEYSVVEHSQMIAARDSLKVLIDNVLAPDHNMENPVTQAQGRAQFEATATAPDKVLLSRIETLSARLNLLEKGEKNYLLSRTLSTPFNAVSLSHLQNARGAFITRPTSETLRFELEDMMDDVILANFRAQILEPLFGHLIHTVRSSPRHVEVEYSAGSISDNEMYQIHKAAKMMGIIVQQV